MTEQQMGAITCAYTDLVGAYQCAIHDGNGHDWEAHRQTIIEMEMAFPEIIESIGDALDK
jgi:hypothetical protein